MAKVAIIYYSATGTTYQLAKAIEEGAKEAGAEVRLLKVHELAPEEAIASNEGWSKHRLETQHLPKPPWMIWNGRTPLFLGYPTRYGLPSAQLKQFLDTTGPLWGQGKFNNKSGRHFARLPPITVGMNQRFWLSTTCSIAGGPSLSARPTPIQFSFRRVTPTCIFTSQNGAVAPDETALAAARFQGKRVTEVTTKFVGA